MNQARNPPKEIRLATDLVLEIQEFDGGRITDHTSINDNDGHPFEVSFPIVEEGMKSNNDCN